MKKLFIGNLPQDATEDSVREMFSAFGTVRSISVASDIFTGRCKGFGFIEWKGTRPVPHRQRSTATWSTVPTDPRFASMTLGARGRRRR